MNESRGPIDSREVIKLESLISFVHATENPRVSLKQSDVSHLQGLFHHYCILLKERKERRKGGRKEGRDSKERNVKKKCQIFPSIIMKVNQFQNAFRIASTVILHCCKMDSKAKNFDGCVFKYLNSSLKLGQSSTKLS